MTTRVLFDSRSLCARPLVSVIVVSYNHAQWVVQALDSVRDQTLHEFEIVAIDDCSSDGTADVIASWMSSHQIPGLLLRNPANQGLLRTLNIALDHRRGAFVGFLAADDRILPRKLEVQMALINENRGGVSVYSDSNRIDAENTPLAESWLEHFCPGPRRSGEIFIDLLRGYRIPLHTLLIPAHILDRIGPFDETLSYEDRDFELRLASCAPILYSDYISADYRVLETGLRLSLSDASFLRSNVRIYSKWLRSGAEARRIARRKMMIEAYLLYELRAPGALAVLLSSARKSRSLFAMFVVCLAVLRVPSASALRLGIAGLQPQR